MVALSTPRISAPSASAVPVRSSGRHLCDERGTTLIETAVAMAILIVMMLGLLSLSAVATVVMENEGNLMARTSEYAQDKMEQLLALKYGDTVSNTTVFPFVSSGGRGLTVGGSSDPANPQSYYTDYLDIQGRLLPTTGIAPPAGWHFKRVWSVAQAAPNLKQISVTATVIHGLGRRAAPRTTMTTYKVYPF